MGLIGQTTKIEIKQWSDTDYLQKQFPPLLQNKLTFFFYFFTLKIQI